MYHEVTPRPHPAFRKYSVTPKEFGLQMRWLRLFGYQTINLDFWLAHRHDEAALPSKPVIITFDDGFRDCADYATAILCRHGFTAVFYVVAGYMGQSSRWLSTEKGCELPLMNWATARQLESAGFQVGAHSMTHPRLAQVPREQCRKELFDCRHELEQNLGRDVRHFAYPYGSYDEIVREIVAEAGYASACSVRIGLSAPDDDNFALHRVPISGHESLLDFLFRLQNGHSLRERLQFCRQRARWWLGLSWRG